MTYGHRVKAFLRINMTLPLMFLVAPLLPGTAGHSALAQCPTQPGDANCSGSISSGDIAPFVLALTDPTAYQAQHQNCSIDDLDLNSDLLVDGQDIAMFVVLLTSPTVTPTLTYLSQERYVEGLVRAFDDNSDITVTDNDAAADFGPFINSVNLFQDSASSGGYSDAFQNSSLCPRSIHARGNIVVEAIVAPGGFSGRAACYGASDFEVSFTLSEPATVDFSGFLDAIDTDVFVKAYLIGPEGVIHEFEAEENTITFLVQPFLIAGTYTLTIECSGEVFNLTPGTFDGRFGEYDVLLRLFEP